PCAASAATPASGKLAVSSTLAALGASTPAASCAALSRYFSAASSRPYACRMGSSVWPRLYAGGGAEASQENRWIESPLSIISMELVGERAGGGRGRDRAQAGHREAAVHRRAGELDHVQAARGHVVGDGAARDEGEAHALDGAAARGLARADRERRRARVARR